MKKMYKFYYDESEHSRVINDKTFFSDNFYDNFITAIVGWSEENDNNVRKKYETFEKKFGNRKSNGEIKSSSIKNKHLKYGLHSMNKENIQFIEEFLNIFDEDIFIYYSSGSKIEILILEALGNSRKLNNLIFRNAVYTIVKSLNIYKPKRVLKSLFSKKTDFVKELKGFYAEKIKDNQKNLQLKFRENYCFQTVIDTLGEFKPDFTDNWKYEPPFVGFKKLLKESKISNCELYIDKEGKGDTLEAAKNVLSFKVEEVCSQKEFGVRISDILAGIISKFMKSMRCDLNRNIRDNEIIKTNLSEEWFKIDKTKYNLYKKLAYVLIDINNFWYRTYASICSDDLISFISFLTYINSFDKFEDFEKINNKKHSEDVCLISLKKMRSNFQDAIYSANVIENTGDNFFYNEKGAKIFFDSNLQPELTICSTEQFTVLSVGIKEGVPLITIYENGLAKCYRIDENYSDWIKWCILSSQNGENPFPAIYEFSKIDGK